MKQAMISFCLLLILLPYLQVLASEPENLPPAEVKRRLAKYAAVPLRADISGLPLSERRALEKLIEAVRAIDDLYWKQRSAQGLELRAKLAKSRSVADRDLLHFLKINYAPYDKNDGDKPFIGTKPILPGATFYPEDLSKEELERYIAQHPEVKADFEKINTVIRREGDKLVAVPFEEIYRPELERAAKALRAASEYTSDAAFKKYLILLGLMYTMAHSTL